MADAAGSCPDEATIVQLTVQSEPARDKRMVRKMDAHQIDQLVRQQIGNDWDTTNWHGVNLRDAVMPAERIRVIDRDICDREVHDQLIDVWLVLIEDSTTKQGYRIVAAEDGSIFGLAVEDLKTDKQLVVVGWYGDFMETFSGM